MLAGDMGGCVSLLPPAFGGGLGAYMPIGMWVGIFALVKHLNVNGISDMHCKMPESSDLARAN